jgi:hypothetical protein
MRQFMVDLKAEYPDFTPGQIASMCALQFQGCRASKHTGQAVLANGPALSVRPDTPRALRRSPTRKSVA